MGRGLLITTSTFPCQPDDGSPRFVLDLAEALADRFRVTVLAPGAPGVSSRERWDEVNVERFAYFWPRRFERLAYGGGMPANLRASFLAKAQVPTFLLAQKMAVRRAVEASGATVVNSHWMVPQGLSVALARGRRPQFRHLLHIHAADVYLLAKLRFGARLARFIMGRTDMAFADGSHVRDALDGLLGYTSKAVLRPNGVDTALFRPGSGEPTPESPFPQGHLVFVGRFVEKKGVEYLLRSLPKVLDTYPDLGLVLVGYGPLEEALRSEAERLGVSAAVRFAGRLPHGEIVGLLHASRVAVVPSIIDQYGETEGMPTVVLEAMAAGCRVVASAVDGIPDVVRNGENGWLCREKDPRDLAAKLLQALESPEGPAVCQEGLRTASLHDWTAVAETYARAITTLESAGD